MEGMTTQGQTETSQGSGSAASAGSSSQAQQGSQSSGSPAAPQVTKTPENVNSASGSNLPGTNVPAVPTWQPNWKFKAAGKEHEIPEWLRGAVKDAETEKNLRELHEKAYGLDLVKNNYQSAQQQVQQFQKQIMPEFNTLKKSVQSVIMFRNNGDLDSVFETIGIPTPAIAKWLHQKIQLQEMPPEARSAFENEQKLRKQNYALQEKVQNLSQGHEQTEMQARAFELQTALAKPDVKTIADSYNARLGNEHAFWDFVCQQADFLERTSGQRVNAENAVSQALRILGNAIVPGQAQPGAQATPGATPGASAPQPGAGQATPTPPVIPNVTGARNASPTKKLARSLDDLRKLQKEMAGKTA